METEKPAALKTDDKGNCIYICREGQLEYISRMINEEGLSQREAARSFIEAVNSYVNVGDPITSTLTVDKVRDQFRRDSGLKKDVGRTAPTEMSDEQILEEEESIREQYDRLDDLKNKQEREKRERESLEMARREVEPYRDQIKNFDELGAGELGVDLQEPREAE